MHADAVPVHVDFTLGTNSVLTDGELQTTQQVVVDGQEKLVDGSNVCPQQARSATGAKGASGSTGSTGSSGATGAKGATGPKGAKGSTGATGNHGKKSQANSGGPTQ
jgi:hypothetical protein